VRWLLSISLMCLSTYLSVLLANSSISNSEVALTASEEPAIEWDGRTVDVLLDADAIAAYEIDRKARELNSGSEFKTDSEVKSDNINR
jgi:hypothetical protein